MNQSQRALLGTISSALTGIRNAGDEIDGRPELPPLGDDAVSVSAWATQRSYTRTNETSIYRLVLIDRYNELNQIKSRQDTIF